MSSRVLRKLHGGTDELELKEQDEEDISDIETDVGSSGGNRKKQFNLNRYDLVI